MAKITRPKFAARVRPDRTAEGEGHTFGYLSNGRAVPATDVDGLAVDRIAFGGEQVCARDVFHVTEVAGLLAVLVYDRWLAREDAR